MDQIPSVPVFHIFWHVYDLALNSVDFDKIRRLRHESYQYLSHIAYFDISQVLEYAVFHLNFKQIESLD